jgi:hypothetical protein
LTRSGFPTKKKWQRKRNNADTGKFSHFILSSTLIEDQREDHVPCESSSLLSFRAARIVAMKKGVNKLDPGIYRPVAVLSNLSKIFERILNFLDGTDFFDSN